MDAMSLEQLVRNIDHRLDRVEQFLPTLATREEMHAAIREAVAPLATKDDMRALEQRVEQRITEEADHSRAFEQRVEQRITEEADQSRAFEQRVEQKVADEADHSRAFEQRIEQKVADEADQSRAFEQRVEQRITEEADQSRAQSRALFENLKDDVRLLAEGIVNVQQTLDQTIRPILGNHERRITVLEVGRGPGPVRRRG